MTRPIEHQNIFGTFARAVGVCVIAVALLEMISLQSLRAQDEPPTVLITGANASHGLAFANDYAELGWSVIATCRNPDKADRLKALAEKYPNIVIEELDIVDYDEVDQLAEKYRDTPIDVLLLNGAINVFRTRPNNFGSIDYEWFEEILKVNIVGQLRVSEAFLPHVEASSQKKIIAMTSTGGSIANVKVSGAVGYRTSKAGLNMAMRLLSNELKDRGVIVSIMAPGTVDSEDCLTSAPVGQMELIV